MPWRVEDNAVDVLIHEITPPQMVVEVQHDRDRFVSVRYFNRDREEVEIAIEHIDNNNVRVSAVNFLDGHLLVI